MLGNKPASPQPFWVDDPDPYSPARTSQRNWATHFSRLLFSLSSLVRLALLVFFVLIALRFPIAWIFVLLEGGLWLARVLVPRRRDALAEKAARIQQLAKDTTGASHIGSALHTAGHPLLEANQPVVLALKDGRLSIHGYTSSTVIDTLELRDLRSIEMVVYDDDRVPHTGVIDNTAQALQLTFPWHAETCVCLFRRMYKVRPVEWYQAIQTARLLPLS